MDGQHSGREFCGVHIIFLCVDIWVILCVAVSEYRIYY